MKDPLLFLAPMAEITTAALRREIRRHSKNVILFSEMISAPALVRGGAYNDALVRKHDFDDPIIYQILGNEPEVMGEAAAILSEKNIYGININMGCSAPEIRNRGCGSALMDDITLASSIVKSCRKAVTIPVSVKIRCGFKSFDENHLREFVAALIDNGADMIAIHPRRGDMAFRRKADWGIVKDIAHFSTPIIGNGDIETASDAITHLRETACSGVMIGRHAVQKPWIFADIENRINSGHAHTDINIKECALNILSGIEEFLPPEFHKSRSRRYVSYFTKNLYFGHALLSKLVHETEISVMKNLIEEYFLRNRAEEIITI